MAGKRISLQDAQANLLQGGGTTKETEPGVVANQDDALKSAAAALRCTIGEEAKHERTILFDVQVLRSALAAISCGGGTVGIPLEATDQSLLSLTMAGGNQYKNIQLASLFLDYFAELKYPDDLDLTCFEHKKVIDQIHADLGDWEIRSISLGPYAKAIDALKQIESAQHAYQQVTAPRSAIASGALDEIHTKARCIASTGVPADRAFAEAARAVVGTMQPQGSKSIKGPLRALGQDRIITAEDIPESADRRMRRLVLFFAHLRAEATSGVEVADLLGYGSFFEKKGPSTYLMRFTNWSCLSLPKCETVRKGPTDVEWKLTHEEKYACQRYAAEELKWTGSSGKPWPEWIRLTDDDCLAMACDRAAKHLMMARTRAEELFVGELHDAAQWREAVSGERRSDARKDLDSVMDALKEALVEVSLGDQGDSGQFEEALRPYVGKAIATAGQIHSAVVTGTLRACATTDGELGGMAVDIGQSGSVEDTDKRMALLLTGIKMLRDVVYGRGHGECRGVETEVKDNQWLLLKIRFSKTDDDGICNAKGLATTFCRKSRAPENGNKNRSLARALWKIESAFLCIDAVQPEVVPDDPCAWVFKFPLARVR